MVDGCFRYYAAVTRSAPCQERGGVREARRLAPYQFRFGGTKDFALGPPEYVINVAGIPS